MSYVPESEILYNKPNVTSELWLHFGLRRVGGELEKTNPVCRICRKIIPAKQGNAEKLKYCLDQCSNALFKELYGDDTVCNSAAGKVETKWRASDDFSKQPSTSTLLLKFQKIPEGIADA